MSIHTVTWPAGTPCWADLTVPDLPSAKAFYSTVLGWEFVDSGDEFGGYAIATARGHAAAGIGPAQPGVPSAWTLYLASDDTDATAAAVTAHGGQVLLEPGNVGRLGRMCIAADPSGAVFGVWQAGEHIGVGIVNEPGGLTWADLRSTDPAAAKTFYATVFGHSLAPLAEGGPDYALFTLDNPEAPMGGMGGMADEPEGTPSHWLLYFGVWDAENAAASAKEAGGAVLIDPFDTPYGTMAALRDPAGATFWIAAVKP